MIPTGGPGPGSSLSLSRIICIQGEPLYSVQPGRIGLAHAFQTKKEEKEQCHTAFIRHSLWIQIGKYPSDSKDSASHLGPLLM
eukprot:134685-Hanusia_phi.AAC.1